MQDACSSLEIEFKRVANDLEFVAHRIESDTHKSSSSNGMPDVLGMVRRLAALQERVASVTDKIAVVGEKRTTMENGVCKQLLDNFQQLNMLVTVSDMAFQSADDWHASSEEVAAALETHEQDGTADSTALKKSSSASASGAVGIKMSMATATHTAPSSVFSRSAAAATTAASSSKAGTLAGGARGAGSGSGSGSSSSSSADAEDAAAYITPLQFKSVPVSVRGRCKLADMHAVVAHCLSNRGCTSVKELEAAGTKLAGKTGVQMLATLRHLNVIKTNRQEITLLTPQQTLQMQRRPLSSSRLR